MVKLFIAGFPKEKDDEWFVEFFSQYGSVREVAMVKSEDILKNLGYGFITMGDQESATRVIAALNGSNVEGRYVNLRIA